MISFLHAQLQSPLSNISTSHPYTVAYLPTFAFICLEIEHFKFELIVKERQTKEVERVPVILHTRSVPEICNGKERIDGIAMKADKKTCFWWFIKALDENTMKVGDLLYKIW